MAVARFFHFKLRVTTATVEDGTSSAFSYLLKYELTVSSQHERSKCTYKCRHVGYPDNYIFYINFKLTLVTDCRFDNTFCYFWNEIARQNFHFTLLLL